MGGLLREYWIPAMRAAQIGESGGAPVGVELLGERFVAFRADDGRIGFFAEACPHRGASLVLARNEDCALRCIYHGWQIDVSGKVRETPSERAGRPDRHGLADRVKVRHYPVVEAGGIIWVWLGPPDRKPPRFPSFSFTSLPADHIFGITAVVECNWLQGVEADVDSSHVSLLHETEASRGHLSSVLDDSAPRDDFDPQPYGLRIGAIRTLRTGETYVRVKPYAIPWYTIVPESPAGDRLWHAWVPMTDHRTLVWYLWYNEEQPVAPERFADQFGLDLDRLNPDNFREDRTRANLWGQDRAAMRSGQSFSGIRGIAFQDIAVQESMGPVLDRSLEHRGSSDLGIVRTRRLLLDAVRNHAAGGRPHGLDDDVDYSKIRSGSVFVGPGEDWRLATF
jgi:phenylpropionate dioxygenase-like ring-hydroxylating dioxygenase large terminal subunit